MTRTRIGCLLLLLLQSLSKPVVARDYCAEDWACAGVEHDGDETVFYLENKKPYPITMTLNVETANMEDKKRNSGDFVVTRVLPKQGKQEVLRLSKKRSWLRANYYYDFEWSPGSMHARHNDNYRYQMPYAKDAYFRIIQGFSGGFSHWGASKYAIDFAMPVGTPVHAARGGIVIDVTEHNWRGGANRRYAKYANFVVVLHDDNTTGEYYHLKQNGAAVKVGDQVAVGQLIGYSGNTGFSSMPHLHFAVYKAKSHGKYQSVPFRFAR